MSRRLIGRIRNGVYERVDGGQGAPIKDRDSDYWKGVAPSDMGTLDGRELHLIAERVHGAIVERRGTAEETAKANETLNAIYREVRGRRQTIR